MPDNTLELISDLAEALQNCLLHQGKPMPEEDMASRQQLVDRARALTQPRTLCRHCQRPIVQDEDGAWLDPEATGDDSIWRLACDRHDTFTAEHEP